MEGLFISFEGTEGSGKSTQVIELKGRLTELGHEVLTLREPGGTPIGEEIRHTLKHSDKNHDMTSETELLLMNASRAQLVGETIRPALKEGKIVICDRFFDSTTVYQGYGRGLDLEMVRQIISCAVGDTRPDVTLLLAVPVEISEARRRSRLLPGLENIRDRMEEADRKFFERVEDGYRKIAAGEPKRIRSIDATQSQDRVSAAIWAIIEPMLPKAGTSPRKPAVDKSGPSATVDGSKKKLSF